MSGGKLPQKKIRHSKIASGAIFVLKFIFGLDATRILGPNVFGAPLTMLHSSPYQRGARAPGARPLVPLPMACKHIICQLTEYI